MINHPAMQAIRETAREAVKQLEQVAELFDLANRIAETDLSHAFDQVSMSEDARTFLYHVTEQMFSIVQNKYNVRRANNN